MLLTCLGYLGWHDTNTNDPFCVALPKVPKASKEGDIVSWYRLCFCQQTSTMYMSLQECSQKARVFVPCKWSLLTKMSVILRWDITLLTCLGYPRQHDTSRNDPFCVALPKVAKASKEGDNVTNVFANKLQQCTQKARVFVPCKSFQPSVMLGVKARSLCRVYKSKVLHLGRLWPFL
jgi:hypothetical protein